MDTYRKAVKVADVVVDKKAEDAIYSMYHWQQLIVYRADRKE